MGCKWECCGIAARLQMGRVSPETAWQRGFGKVGVKTLSEGRRDGVSQLGNTRGLGQRVHNANVLKFF
jgi:hypothetical protein